MESAANDVYILIHFHLFLLWSVPETRVVHFLWRRGGGGEKKNGQAGSILNCFLIQPFSIRKKKEFAKHTVLFHVKR